MLKQWRENRKNRLILDLQNDLAEVNLFFNENEYQMPSKTRDEFIELINEINAKIEELKGE